MGSLAIGWQYLTGYAVATDCASRDRAEWPPHPGRVFLALAAAWFECAEEPEQGDALRWLESLGDPELRLPSLVEGSERSNVTVYVPVNDRAGPASATIQSAPAFARSRQPRTFPRRWVGDDACYLVWQNAEGIDRHQGALSQLCANVTRIGHSSSLVRMWVADADSAQGATVWSVDDGLSAELHCRVATPGTLDALPEQTQIPRIEMFAELDARIRAAKGKAQKEAKVDFQRILGSAWSKNAAPPPLLRPRLGIWRGYRRRAAVESADAPCTQFDTDVLVLTKTNEARALPLASTLAVTRALRNTIMSYSGEQPPPPWVSGHEPNGEPHRSVDDAHMACLPIPFVGNQHADGHLVGVAIAFPRSAPRSQRGRVLGPLLLTEEGELRRVSLTLGALGVWTVEKRDWSDSRWAVQPETWTAHPAGERTWASVTPVVLDRFPKADRTADRPAWTEEVIEIVRAACARIGLPSPEDVDVDTTSWLRGSPRAVCKRRPVRTGARDSHSASTAIGDGFPAYPAKGSNALRHQVHVWLRFSKPVVGPILLGAGRYMGYGLCKPLREGR